MNKTHSISQIVLLIIVAVGSNAFAQENVATLKSRWPRIWGEALGGGLAAAAGGTAGALIGYASADRCGGFLAEDRPCQPGEEPSAGLFSRSQAMFIFGTFFGSLTLPIGTYVAGNMIHGNGLFLPTLVAGYVGAAAGIGLMVGIGNLTEDFSTMYALLPLSLGIAISGSILGYELTSDLDRRVPKSPTRAFNLSATPIFGGALLQAQGQF